MPGSRALRPIHLVMVSVALLSACGGGGTDSTGPGGGNGNQGSISLSAATTASVTITGSTTIGVSITRSGGFTGTVSLAVTGLPSGVAGSFAPPSLGSGVTASVLTLTAAATAAAGSATLTITASASGVTSQSATVQLTVVNPTIGLTLNPTTLPVTAGQTGTATVTITRSAGFAGAVTLALDNPPTGFTGSFSPSPATGTSATLTLTVAASVAAGSYSVAIKGSAAGADDQSVTLSVTVAAAGPVGFTVAVDPVEFELPAGQGWSANGIVSINRTNGFTGAVSVTASGFTGLALAAPSPASIAASLSATNLLALAADGAAPGVYTGTIKVSAAGFADQTAQVRVRVSLPSTGAITWKFCRADRVPRFFAIRDGSGPWKHIVPAGPAAGTAATPTTFSFDLAQPTASVALVWLGEKTSASPLIEGHYWNVYYLTRQEVIDLAAQECVTNPDVTTRTATGSVTGYLSFDALVASVSGRGLASTGSSGPLTTSLTMQNLQPGPFDLLLTRSNFNGAGPDITIQSVVLRRGIDPASGGTIPAIDFSTEGLAPAAATVSFGNTNGEAFTNTMTFRTAAGLNGWMAAAGSFAATNRTWYGVPSGQLQTGDLHQITATTANQAARRQIIHFAHDVSAGSLSFGPALSPPTVTAPAANPVLLDATGTLGTDYVDRVSIYYRENVADPRTMSIVASAGFLGGAAGYDVAVPDLSGVEAFTAFWNFRHGSPVKWTVTGGLGSTGDNLVDAFCVLTGYCPVTPVDGATYKSAQATGIVTIP